MSQSPLPADSSSDLPSPPPLPTPTTRRRFLRQLAAGMFFPALAGGWYSLREAQRCEVTRLSLPVPHLPEAFVGLTVAFLADTHHGPCVPLSYLERVVAMTNDLRPDLVALGGDYVHRPHRRRPGSGNASYIAPGINALGKLRAPLGRFGVLGNHDRLTSLKLTRRALAANGIVELTNAGVWLECGGARLRLCGTDDSFVGRPDLAAALGDAGETDAVILLTHNPDYVERIRDPRVGLVLSGHTHGGQVVLPLFGPPVVPSIHGRKYAYGLVQGPVAKVFVTRGVGTIAPPVRFNCPPEVALITLRRAADASASGFAA